MDVQWLVIFLAFVTIEQITADEYYDSDVEQLIKFYGDDKDEPFMARNCDRPGREPLPLKLIHMNIKPSPIQLGQTLTVNVSFILNQNIGFNNQKIEIDLSIRLKTPWGYTEVCDFVGDELCHTNNLCSHIKYIENDLPKGIPTAKCPFLKGSYNITDTVITTKELPFDLNGAFDMTVWIKEQGKHIGSADHNLFNTETETTQSYNCSVLVDWTDKAESVFDTLNIV